ncbi:hypothetical protein AOPFMNJM_1690 [Methylobacterium jeotgali]|uniref:Peptidase S24/S26A/S26B/S26C domain-containing protein n=2 Tax=Pseudomonadota TaxID=1224 RepID=A0ABQ4ST26_9HYPH|nr:hypothetical protein AOPFMNJM_1690 [Methylobacterium jeotgali]
MRSRDETKAWVEAVLAHLRIRPTELARAIERAPSTLNRFLNDPDATHDLSPETVERIADYAKLRPYERPAERAPRVSGMAEAEAIAYRPEGDRDGVMNQAVEQLVGMRNGVDPWVLQSSALSSIGYLPGDVMLVDLNERPRPHDVVCAQVYDWMRSKAQTVFRLYEPPYLLASTTDQSVLRPLVVDDNVVVVKGVVTASVRPRRNLGRAA